MTDAFAFPIVGIGASAGGVEALEGFFLGLPPSPGVGLVVITHLSPERESLLPQVVARYTKLPVHIVTNGMEVQADHVYVLPSDVVLTIAQGRLVTRKHAMAHRERKPIDIFFSALAIDQGETAAGVILSGSDSDGTLGIKAIKERGGLTFAQIADGYGPHHPDMPESAIATGLVDYAVAAEDMGPHLAEFARRLRVPDVLSADPELPGPADKLNEARTELYAILRNQIGHDFSGYKSKTFLRRVQRRMQVTQMHTVDAYLGRLRSDPQEVASLFRDLLINVTNFFRDDGAFEALTTMIVPRLFENRGADDVIRIWVPGCSTGEEVFSLGILMREHMNTLSAVPRVQIFATDIDERSLSVARTARYPAGMLDGVSAERRARFFVADGASFVVAKDVRELCVFSPHSVIRDPPFSRIDLISCRNVLIYFGTEVQGQVIPTFHYALKPEGYLFLGTSENVSQFDDLFSPMDKKHRIFRRRADSPATLRMPLMVSALRPGLISDLTPRRMPFGGSALRQRVDDHVLERFSPPHVLVNRDGDVMVYSGRTGKYLEAAAGTPTRQLMSMARKGLRLDMRTLFREVVESGKPATREGIALEGEGGGVQIVALTIEPLSERDGGELLYLVLFIDQGPVLTREEALTRLPMADDGNALQTERELRDTRERLQSMIEEYETALEELKSSNEELVSVNEELQSTNEELEASKEELVSVNEELHTVNAELNRKVEELDHANSDLRNLFDSTELATVFLDKSLMIRSFTPAMTDVFSILPSDRGRPITDLSSRVGLPDFAGDIARVLAKGHSIERRADHKEQTAQYLVRLAPYRGGNGQIDGVVVTFVDVSNVTQAEDRQRLLIAELQHRTRNLLAVVNSIAQQTLGKDRSIEAFSARLGALGRVQGLISNAVDDKVDLAEVVRMEMHAMGSFPERISASGPSVPLGLEGVQVFTLALHELATNAIKYGALKQPEGNLEVTWQVEPRDGQPFLVLTWRETGFPEPPRPEHNGYGRQLIERALRFTLRATTELSFSEDGVLCRIEMPLGPATALARDHA